MLDVQCGAGAPVLASGRVQASANGVRFHVTAKAGWELGVDYPMGHEGVVLDAPDQQVVLAVAPGDVMIDCADPSGSGPATTPLRIEDPGGFYRPFTISDGVGKCVTQSNDYVQGARGKAAAPIPQARHLLLGLRAGDVVERAGYSTDTGKVRIVRGRKVIGHLDFEDDGHGGWLLADATLCAKLRAG